MRNEQIAKALLNLAKYIVGPPQPVQPKTEWVTVDEMEEICPICASKMRAKRISKIQRSVVERLAELEIRKLKAAGVKQEILTILEESEHPAPVKDIIWKLTKEKKVSSKTVESALRQLRLSHKIDRVVYANRLCYAVSPARNAAKWQTLPRGWTKKSLEDYWKSLVGNVKHKVTKCIKRMGDTDITDPGAFCAALADKLEPGWRSRTSAVVDLFDSIKPGDKVTILTPRGSRVKGRATMYNRRIQAWVLNLGGRHGTPGLATRDNVVDVESSRFRKAAEKVRFSFKTSSDAEKYLNVAVQKKYIDSRFVRILPNRTTVELYANKVAFSNLGKLMVLAEKMRGQDVSSPSREAFLRQEDIDRLKESMKDENSVRRTEIFMEWIKEKRLPFTDFAKIVSQLQKLKIAERQPENNRFSSEVLKYFRSL